MAITWSRISSKVIAHPPYTNKVCRRWYENRKGYSGAFIPHIVDKRKQEVLREVTLFPQTRGGLCHARLSRLQLPKTRTESRSAPCVVRKEVPFDSIIRSGTFGCSAFRNVK